MLLEFTNINNQHYIFTFPFNRVYGLRQASKSFRYSARSVPQQKMGIQLVRVGAGADHVQILGTMCGLAEVTHCQGRLVSVQEYVPVCQCWVIGTGYKVRQNY